MRNSERSGGENEGLETHVWTLKSTLHYGESPPFFGQQDLKCRRYSVSVV